MSIPSVSFFGAPLPHHLFSSILVYLDFVFNFFSFFLFKKMPAYILMRKRERKSMDVGCWGSMWGLGGRNQII